MRASTSILSLGLALFSAQARAGPQVSTPPFGGPPSGGPPFGGPPFGQPGQNPGHVAKALYLISNQSPNSVIALPVDENGLVSAGTETPTGGNGGAFLQADGVTPVPVDALNSQDPVVRSGDYLHVVNFGSGTISTFAIDPQDPLKLELTEPPTELIGDYPNTIAASRELGLVCVGTAGPKNGVECFKSYGGHLQPDGVGLRPFGISEQSPPLMMVESITDLFFSTDLQWLYAPIKGQTGTHGWLSVFPVSNGCVGATDVQSTSTEVNALFGGFPNPYKANELFLSDASFGGVVFTVASNGSATLAGKGVTAPAVRATCWSEYSVVTHSAWLTSPISNTLVEFNVDTAAQIGQYNITVPSGIGFVDLVIPGDYLYTLSTGKVNGTASAITVVDLSKSTPELVQYFPIGFGADNYAAGLAYYSW